MAGKYVDVTLRLIDKMSSPLKAAGAKLKDSADQWKRAGRQIQNAGKSISAVGGSMTKTLTVPIAAIGATSVLSFGEVDKSLKLVKSTMGDAKWATADLEGAMKNAAVNSVFTMNDAANASLNFARQGFNAKEAADMLEPALSLAAGTATDLSDVTSGLGNALKVFSSQGLTAKNAADIFAKAQAQANTTTTELFQAMRVGASTFSTVGWSMQDLAAITGVFGDNSISASEGANAMKTGLARLVAPVKDGAVWMETLGLNLVNTDGTMKSMLDVQRELHGAFSKLTQEQQMQAASAIFGKQQMGRWLALIRTAPETLQKYRGALDETSGTADGMANSLLSGVGGSIEKLKSTFDVFKYSIGSVLGDSVKKLIDRATGLLDKFNKLDPAMQKNIVKIGLTVAAIGPMLLIFGKTVTTVGKVVSVVGKVGKAFKTFGTIAGMIGSPVGIVIAVLAALVVAGVLVYKNWDKIKATAGKVFGYVGKVMHACGVSGDWLKKILTPIGDKFTAIGAKLKGFWEIFEPVTSKINEINIAVFKVGFGIAIGGAIGYFKSMVVTLGNFIDGIISMYGGLITFITGIFTGDWKKAWEGVKEIFGGTFKALESLVRMPMNAVIGIINGAIAGINKLGLTIPDWVPVIGGKDFRVNIPVIPQLAKGTENWKGGLVQVHERGGEIIDLPRGTRVYPHDKSIQMAYRQGSKRGASLILQKLADQIIIREDADIDKIVDKLADMLKKTSENMGGDIDGYIPELG